MLFTRNKDSVITGKDNASKDWNCIIITLMFVTSFFLLKTGWQTCCWSLGLKFRDWLLHWLKLTNLFSKAHTVYLYYSHIMSGEAKRLNESQRLEVISKVEQDKSFKQTKHRMAVQS